MIGLYNERALVVHGVSGGGFSHYNRGHLPTSHDLQFALCK
jgi:hypothetical protein